MRSIRDNPAAEHRRRRKELRRLRAGDNPVGVSLDEDRHTPPVGKGTYTKPDPEAGTNSDPLVKEAMRPSSGKPPEHSTGGLPDAGDDKDDEKVKEAMRPSSGSKESSKDNKKAPPKAQPRARISSK